MEEVSRENERLKFALSTAQAEATTHSQRIYSLSQRIDSAEKEKDAVEKEKTALYESITTRAKQVCAMIF